MRLAAFSLAFFVACGTTTPADPAPDPTKAPEGVAAETPADAPAVDAAAAGAEPGGEAEAPAEEEEEAAETAALDPAKLEEAKGLARAMMPKAAMMDAVKPVLGEPTTMSDTEATWMAKDGDSCKVLKVSLMADMVGSATIEDAPCPSGDAE